VEIAVGEFAAMLNITVRNVQRLEHRLNTHPDHDPKRPECAPLNIIIICKKCQLQGEFKAKCRQALVAIARRDGKKSLYWYMKG
jgi:hypothetical protein